MRIWKYIYNQSLGQEILISEGLLQNQLTEERKVVRKSKFTSCLFAVKGPCGYHHFCFAKWSWVVSNQGETGCHAENSGVPILQARRWKHGFRSQAFRWSKFKAPARCGSVSCRPARSAAPPQLGTFLSKQQNPTQQVNNWVSFFYYHHQSSILFWQEVAECLAPNPLRCNLI